MRLLDPELIEDIREHCLAQESTLREQPKIRGTVQRKMTYYPLDYTEFPELNAIITDLLPGHICKSFEYLRYDEGGFVGPHTDLTGYKTKHPRVYTIVTLMHKSDDLEGGDLILDGEVKSLNIGDSILFESDTIHEVSKVTKGSREVLVAWITKNE